jgi:hypothetical protein
MHRVAVSVQAEELTVRLQYVDCGIWNVELEIIEVVFAGERIWLNLRWSV